MSISAPPKASRPPLLKPPAVDTQDALIEEARQRARRRRRLYGATALVGGLIAIGSFVAFGRGHGSASQSLLARGSAGGIPARPAPVSNGPLAIIACRGGCAGWYAVSEIGAAGALRPFVRCPHRAQWCGEVVGIAWSPDGRRLAISVDSVGLPNPYNGLRIISLATGRDRLVDVRGNCASDLAWSPDGSKLAYTCWPYGGLSRQARIEVIGTDGSEPTVLPVGGEGPVFHPTWAPDSRQIAFATSTGIYVANLDSSHQRLLAANGNWPAWSPDGRRIAYRTRCGAITFITPAGKNVTPSGEAFRCGTFGRTAIPEWSPDGNKLAISTRLGKSPIYNAAGIYAMNADGTDLLFLTHEASSGFNRSGASRPAWRPIPLAKTKSER
jgi:Tol biopolymer transport system component